MVGCEIFVSESLAGPDSLLGVKDKHFFEEVDGCIFVSILYLYTFSSNVLKIGSKA